MVLYSNRVSQSNELHRIEKQPKRSRSVQNSRIQCLSIYSTVIMLYKTLKLLRDVLDLGFRASLDQMLMKPKAC